MLSFRKKIYLADLVLLVVFVAILFPLAGFTARRIMRLSLINQAKSLIVDLGNAPNQEAMITMVETQPKYIFQLLCILDGQGKVLYSSYLTLLKDTNIEYSPDNGPEISDAIKYGEGFDEHISPVLNEKFYYVAKAFRAHGEKYIFVLSFRSSQINRLKDDFEIGILILAILILVISSSVHMIVIQFVMRPIQQIIDCIRPYKEGKEELLPRIILNEEMQGGEFSKLAYTLNSLTERIQNQIDRLTRQRKETEDILESISEGIIATDASAQVTFVNQVACRMLGVPRSAILKQTLNAMKTPYPDLSKKCHELILHALQTSEPSVQTWTFSNKGPLFLHLISAPLTHQSGALLVLQDKTSDYKVIEMGKDFIANASHELRTPITIIRGFAETLQDLPELSQAMLHDITEKIVRTCGRLDKLVRSLLTLADIENLSEDRLKTADLIAIAENAKYHFLTAHPNVQLTLKCQLETAPIVADIDLFEMAVINLLENAMKYSQAPAQIEMSIYQEEQEVYLSVQDRGIGISESDVRHIFDRFYTVDKARSRKSGGAGLGLSIVKTIIEKHNGRIIVTSELNKGSNFTLVVPLKKE